MTALAERAQEDHAVELLTQAIAALTSAVDAMPIGEVVAIKGQIVTIQTATKELGMSKDAQDLATEAVRRAEWALGRAIKKGQSDGTIAKRGDVGGPGGMPGVVGGISGSTRNGHLATPKEITGVRNASELQPLYEMATATPAEFEAALVEAKDEGNLSRNNMVRKVKSLASPVTRDQRADLIADLAEQGYTSRQMVEQVGTRADRIREIARAYNIDIPGDRSASRTKQPESTRIATSTVTALEGLAMGVDLIDYDVVDVDPEWVESLTHSLKCLNRFARQIKEKVR